VADAPVVVLSERLGPVTELERRLESTGAQVRGRPLWTVDDIRAHGGEARIIILGAVEPFDAVALAALPNLHAIVRRGVGVDNVDLEAATRLGIVIAHVTDATVEEVSDHALALLLAVERQVAQLDAGVRRGAWVHDASAIIALRAPIRRFRTLTLGVVGLGRIGRTLALKAGPLYGCILASDPFATADSATSVGAELVSRDELLRSADHVSLHVPLAPDTHHLVDAEALLSMRPGAVLVNTARGGLVDEAAVLAAVRAGHLGGAGLDVNEREPLPPDDPLLGEPRILLTAHSAASSQTANEELARRSVDAVAALLSGVRPEAIANPEVLMSPALRAPLHEPG
jgi:D-3-phosphoglycerate dehydrogenase / 2-oxoglutarate reductase